MAAFCSQIQFCRKWKNKMNFCVFGLAFFPGFAARAKKYCPEKYEAIFEISGCDVELFAEKVTKLADVKINVDIDEIESISLRWKGGIKNFDRTPGGFTYIDARNALAELIS